MTELPVLTVHRRGDQTEIELVDHGASPEIVAATVAEVTALIADAEAAGSTVHLAAEHPPARLADLPEAVADATGFGTRRDLLQLRRPLPVPADHPARLATRTRAGVRAFVPGRDDQAWIRANNRSFAEHPDQGRETDDTLADRMAEPWFDPADFLVSDDPHRHSELAGFCWTKVHPADGDDPEIGEIYVIGVDPAHAGKGLGTPLVLAGLDHLAGKGITVANLYVDADNEAARRLYDRLDFTTHTRRRVYTRGGS